MQKILKNLPVVGNYSIHKGAKINFDSRLVKQTKRKDSFPVRRYFENKMQKMKPLNMWKSLKMCKKGEGGGGGGITLLKIWTAVGQ